jgi:hypothetical protein
VALAGAAAAAVGLALAASVGVACGPETSLGTVGAATEGGSPAPSGPPAAALLQPAPGAFDVPPNLSALTLRGPTGLGDGASPISLTAAGEDGATAAPSLAAPILGPARPVDCSDGASDTWTCVLVPLAGSLAPATTYVVSLEAGLLDASGLPLRSGPVGQFTTAAAPDLVAPAITRLAVSLSGPCVLVSFRTDEPAAGQLVIRPSADPDPAADREVPVGRGLTVFQAAARLGAVPPGTDLSVLVRAIDPAGNLAESAAVELTLPASAVPLAITEIHANPAGPEPAQEFVELENLGALPLDVGGMTLEDGRGSDVLPAVSVPGRAYALVVPTGFDPASVEDTPPAAGTILLRVDARLGGDGLSNAGEAIRLRAADGALLSSYGSATPTATAAWSGRSIHRIPEDACDQPATWTTQPRPATPGWGPP